MNILFLFSFIMLECDSGWTLFNGHCYQRQTKKLSYDQARAECKSKEAIIAVPNTLAENDFLKGEMNSNGEAYTWIGFDYENSELWEDGTSSTALDSWRILYNVDDSGKRNKGQPAVFIRPSGAWSFDAKNEQFQFICEKAEQSGPYPTGLSIVVSKKNDNLANI